MKAITAQKSILILALWVLLCQPLYAQKTKTHENFKLVDNFDKDKKSVKTETFSLPNISVDGGKGVAYHTEKNGYKVYALELSGETEKIQYVFYADAKSNLKIIKQTEYKYDKPTATDNLRKAITTFYSYENNSLRAYNQKRRPIIEPDPGKKKKLDKLFENIINRN